MLIQNVLIAGILDLNMPEFRGFMNVAAFLPERMFIFYRLEGIWK
jgi:hypothetical protein